MLRKEWPSLVGELLENNRITKVQAETFAHLNIVGLVGSIEWVFGSQGPAGVGNTTWCADRRHFGPLRRSQQRHGHDRFDHRWIDRSAQDLRGRRFDLVHR